MSAASATGTRTTAAAPAAGFRDAAQVVLDYLNTHVPMAFWSITRLENDRQSYLYLDQNDYGLAAGGSHPWEDSYCVHMVEGKAPRIAPDVTEVPLYAHARINESVQIGAYAGAPIVEPDGSLFGAICGLDRHSRPDLSGYAPMLNVLSELLNITLASDRARKAAELASSTALTHASTDALTGIHNRRAWNDRVAQLELDFATYADPTVIVVIDLDNLKQVNDGPGGHSAGDHLLRTAADAMRRSMRDRDFLARLGGDEFGIILTNTAAAMAPVLAGRISAALERAGALASVGWSAMLAGSTVQQTVELADRAMYAVKQQRRLVGARPSPQH